MAGTGVISVDAALAHLLQDAEPLARETVTLARALGRMLADDIDARLTQPPFAASAMDGYAIRWEDMPGPWQVIGEAAAGRGFAARIRAGEAIRIFTGAPIPDGADTIVVQEEITCAANFAALAGAGPPHRGAHVRAAGQDFRRKDRIASAGSRLTPARLGLIAAAGHGEVAVIRQPRVTLIATGDELVPPGATPGPDQIASSSPVMVSALLETAGAIVSDSGIVGDTTAALRAVIAATEADVIITIGGASVGDHDLIVPVLREIGAAIDFWKIAMRPGKPMLAGRLGAARVIGLPGNPVSAFVCTLLFAVPLVARLGGRNYVLPIEWLRLAGPLPANGDRRDHLRAQRTPAGVLAFAAQDSARLGILANADLLILREPGAPAVSVGEKVSCIALDTFPAVS